MPLAPGTRLGPYEILAPLGAGGMGEVYRAKDSRLGREVAVKVLPQHLSADPEVRARFEREAKTVSSLNHPHICVLHDVGREGGTDFLVMELVEGETLAARLTRGPLAPAEVLRLGGQIADALDRAHRAGVIHRDLKPGNVMLTRSGAKLMDFGLARATGLAGPAGASGLTAALTQSPTAAAPLTAEGTIVGTFQYMSPEQLEGKDADTRSDLWSLGCVLYEMATGRRAFTGATQASLISAIMRDMPRAMNELAPMSPPALERLVTQCLAKDPDDRWQSAGDVRRALEWIAGGVSSGAVSQTGMSATAARRGRLPAGALGLAGGAVIAVAALLYALGPWHVRDAQAPPVRFVIASPTGAVLGTPAEAALSPDGTVIVFVAADSGGTSHLFLRPLASPEARMLAGTEDAFLPFWSPDSRALGFFSHAKLRTVALDGSAPVEVCDATDARGGAWSREGVIVFAPNNQGGLARVPASGGAPTPITQVDTTRHELGHRYPQFLPDGRHFLYVAVGAAGPVTTFAASLAGGRPVEVCQGGSIARYAPPGYLVYLDAGLGSTRRRLLARRFDAGSLRPNGDAHLVLDEVNSDNYGYGNVTAAAGGTLVAQHWSPPHSRLTWRDRHGAAAGVAAEDFSGFGGSLSPDGKRLAYTGRDPADLDVLDLTTGVSTRLTFENCLVNYIVWSPDGRHIAFARSSGDRGWDVHMKSADGAGPDSLLFQGPGLFSLPVAWSRDGRWLLLACSDPSGNYDLWRMPMAGGGRPEIYQRTAAQERGGVLSPDGRWVAYVADEGGTRALYVQSFPEPGAKYQVAIDDPVGVVWSDRGDALVVVNGHGGVFEIAVTTVGGFRQGATARLFQMAKGDNLLDIVRGEQRFLTATPKDQSASTRLEVVLGWPGLLGK